MERKKLFMSVGTICLVCGIIASMMVFARPVRAEPIVLRAVTPWVASYAGCKAFFTFQQMVNRQAKGELSIAYLGGEEVIPPQDQFEALRNGVVDIALSAAAYYRGQVPEASIIQLTELPPTQLRKSGFYDAIRKIHLEKGNVIYLVNVSGVGKFRLYFNVPVKKPDLTGLKVRVSPVYIDFVKALNGTPVMIPPADVYTALERGVVQGYGWTNFGIMDYAWHEVTKYVIDHPFYALENCILVNVNVWNKLPGHLRDLLEKIAAEAEARIEGDTADFVAAEDKKLRDAKLEFIKFSPPDAEYFVKTAYDVGWREFLKKFPELGPKLRKLAGS